MRKIDNKISYIRKIYSNEDKLLKKILTTINQYNNPIHIGDEEAKLLQILIKVMNIKNIIELGTHFGYSAIWLTRAMASDGKLTTIEKDINRVKIAKTFFEEANFTNRITQLVGDAVEVLDKLKQNFDMIFIDANKSGYLKYLDWADKNIRKNGLIVADNIFLGGAVYDQDNKTKFNKKNIQLMHEFNIRLANPDKYTSVIIPTSEGFSISIKK